MMLLPLCSWLSGCAPTAEGQFDEQNNPHFRAGKQKLSAFDYKAAIESFERALEENPRSALTHFELGVLYEQQEHDYAAALYHYNKVLKLRPSGYPSDNVRQRIPACRQELLKADSLATISPASFNEIQSLRATNQWLLRELEVARAQLGSRSLVTTSMTGIGQSRGTSGSASGLSSTGQGASRVGLPQGGLTVADGSPVATDLARPGRIYTVKSGDTLAAIARQHGVRLESLQAANQGLNPKRLRAGQHVTIPGR
jgi:LysM repeat protein